MQLNNQNNINHINLNINDLNYKSPIPKIIHRIWMVFNPKKPEMSDEYEKNDEILKNLHPDWYFMEWDDKKTLNFVHDYYPEFYNTYISYDQPIMRHDAARYLILKQFGGVFIQHSFVFQKNIEPLLANYDLVFSNKFDSIALKMPNRKNELSNGIMASVPGHDFWNHIIKAMTEAKKSSVMSATGPFLLSKMVNKYLKENDEQNIKILDAKYLMPFFVSERNDVKIKSKCIDSINLYECFSLYKDAFAYTPWNGDWAKKEYTKAKVNLNYLEQNNIVPKYDKIFIPNLHRSPERWAKTAINFDKLGLKFERFEAVDGYKIDITDPQSGKTFKGVDIKKKIFSPKKDIEYKVKCDNGVQEALEIYLTSKLANPMAANIGLSCTVALIREEIIKRNYNNTIIFEDDFEPNPDNLISNINNFIKALPKYDIAYLHNFIPKRDKLESINSLVYSNGKNDRWWGDWAYMLSNSGARKLNLGYKMVTPSDIYPRFLVSKEIKLSSGEDFKAYFAKHNFSIFSDKYYDGSNSNSISTKMGCRQYHPSSSKDCSKIVELNAVININNIKDSSLENLASANNDLDFIDFTPCNEDLIQIKDEINNSIFTKESLNNTKKESDSSHQYKITCNPNVINPIEFTYNTNPNELSIKNLANWCTNIMLWHYIKNQNYLNVAILENNDLLTDSSLNRIKSLIANAPKDYDLALIENTMSNQLLSVEANGDIENSLSLCLGDKKAWIISAQGIDKLLSINEYSGSVDDSQLCLKNDHLFSEQTKDNEWSILAGQFIYQSDI